LEESCRLPLSIVIVGIGLCDFEKMQIFDDDSGIGLR